MNIKTLIKNPKNYLETANKRAKRLVRTYFFKGVAVTCENCSWMGKQFFNGECPNCKSLPRTRLIPFSIDYFMLSKPGLKVLHVAPNKTEYLGVKSKLSKVIKYDKLDIRAVKHVNIVEDLTNLTLENNSYHVVIIWHVFEHIVEDKKAMSEVYRILKQDGHLLMSVPIYPNNNPTTFEDKAIPYKDFKKIHGHEDHCRSCGLDYYKRFEEIGFNTRELKVNTIEDSLITKYGLSKGHIAWCFSK